MQATWSAAVGGVEVSYNALAAALEGAVKAAGLSRERASDASAVELVVVEHEKKGAWLFVNEAAEATHTLARMLAPPLARALKKTVSLVLVTAPAEGAPSASTLRVSPS